MEKKRVPANKDDERLALIYFVHKNITEYIKFSDTKAGILLAATGILLAQVLRWMQVSFYQGIPLVLYALCLSFLIASFFMFFYSIYPRLKIQRPGGIIFFENIISKRINEYKKAIQNMDADKILTEISEDVYNLSKISHRKYKCIKFGIIFLGIALIFAVIFWFSTLAMPIPDP